MRCPNCGTENENHALNCVSCGATLQDGGAKTAATGLKAVTAGGMVLGKKAREARIKEVVDPSKIISNTAYNGVIGFMLLWGLLINYLLCANVGSYTNIFPNMSPIAFLIGYLVVAIAGMLMTFKSKSPVVGFIGYNLVVIPFGLVISTMVESYIKAGAANAVTLAFLYTLIIAAAMLATVIVFPKAFEKIGAALGVALVAIILCGLVMLLINGRQPTWMSYAAAGLFSLYLGYDIYRSQQYPKTVKNAIASALDIYMDLANIFIRLLEILGKSDN